MPNPKISAKDKGSILTSWKRFFLPWCMLHIAWKSSMADKTIIWSPLTS